MAHGIILKPGDPLIDQYIKSLKDQKPLGDVRVISYKYIVKNNEIHTEFFFKTIGEIKERWVDVTEICDSRKKEMEINTGKIRYGEKSILP